MAAQSVFGRDLAHGGRCVGQHDPADAVTDGVHARHIGLQIVVSDYMAALRGDPSGLQIEGGHIAAAAHRHQDLLSLQAGLRAALILDQDLRTHTTGPEAQDLGLQQELDPGVLHDLLRHPGQLVVHHGHQARHHLHHSDLGAKEGIGAGQLNADHAAADDDHGRGQLLQR